MNTNTNKTNKLIKKQKKPKTNFKTIIREKNLTTLYVLSFLLAVLFVFPKVVDYVMLWVSIILVAIIGLVAYVVINKTNDHVSRPLQQRLIEALPDQAFRYVATSRFLSNPDKSWQVVEPKQIEATEDIVIDAIPTIKQLTLVEAIKQSTDTNWTIGQNDTNYCDINIYDLVHVGVIGATGTGKSSSTALLMMLQALKNNFHVIALDAKSVDWERYNSHIEAYSTDYQSFPNQVDQLCLLHEQRMLLVKNAGVSNVDELEAIPHVLVIMEEFGFLCQSLKAANKQQYEQTISKLSNLMRVSRSSGINFLIIDQKPNGWPNTITANVKGFICYRIKGSLANGIGEYHLDRLAAKGEFSYEGEAYRAWFTKAEIDVLLKKQPKRKNSLLIEYRSEAASNVESSVVIEETTRLIEDSNHNAALPTPSRQPTSIQSYNTKPKDTTITKPSPSITLPKAVSNRLDFVNQLIEIAKTEALNDSKVRKYCKELTGKSLDGVASKVILDYVNSKVQSQV